MPQCDVCGRFCRPYSRTWEHPEYGLQCTFCPDHDPRTVRKEHADATER